MTIRVVLVDDQPLVRAGISMLLQAHADIELVAEGGDGACGIQLSRELQPDVVVMDVRMPGVDGIAATGIIAADDFSPDRDHPVKVLMLTTFHDDDAVVEAIRAGASGFILKETTPQQLVEAVRAVARGEGWLDPAVTGTLLQRLRTAPRLSAHTPALLARLTRREREVLEAMAQGQSNTEIAEAFVLSETTVKTHVGRILMKLGLRDRAQAVAFAYQSGAVTGGPPGRS